MTVVLLGLFLLITFGNDIASVWYKLTNNGKSCGYSCLVELNIGYFQIIFPSLLMIVVVGLMFQYFMVMFTLTKSVINKTDLTEDDMGQTPLSDKVNSLLETDNPILGKIVMMIIMIFSVSIFLFWAFSVVITTIGH